MSSLPFESLTTVPIEPPAPTPTRRDVEPAAGQSFDQHLRRNFRNRVWAQDTPGTGYQNLDPSEALFFWLGGEPPLPEPRKSAPADSTNWT